MPLYKVKCLSCKHEFDELCKAEDQDSIRCEKCNRSTERVFAAPKGPSIYTKFPFTLENVEEHPVTFRTKGDLSRYCKEKGIASGALL